MPSRYTQANQDTYGRLNNIINLYYQEFGAVGVHIDLLMAFAPENEAGEKLGPALKLRGYGCNAIVKIIGLMDRVMGRGDAQIVLDGDRWDKLSPEQRDAILDHEMQHLIIARNVDGETVIDTHGRPKLKMRLHDREFGFFDIIAERHGEASAEVEQCKGWMEDAGAVYFPFMKTLKESRKPKQKKLE
jgi:hypothetical protein